MLIDIFYISIIILQILILYFANIHVYILGTILFYLYTLICNITQELILIMFVFYIVELFQFFICLAVNKISSIGVIWGCRCTTDTRHLIITHTHILEQHPEAFWNSLGSYVICDWYVYFIIYKYDFYTNHVFVINSRVRDYYDYYSWLSFYWTLLSRF